MFNFLFTCLVVLTIVLVVGFGVPKEQCMHTDSVGKKKEENPTITTTKLVVGNPSLPKKGGK
jgi:hypothetical protein